MDVWAPTRFEAMLLFQEIVRDRPYGKHGIALQPGAVVFDVGANIGMYAIHLAATVPRVHVRCFEPIPFLFEALQRNLAAHAPGATARNVGLSSHAGTATFEVDWYSTLTASASPGVFRQAADPCTPLAAWAAAGLADLERVNPRRLVQVLRAGLAAPATRALTLAAMAPIAVFYALRRRCFLRHCTCEVDTLSAAMTGVREAHIDLVKIDVEGAEEQVLDGIGDHDWPRIRQLVIEVHDIEGRRDRLARRLELRGYRTTHDREPWALHALMGISTLYAVRD